MSRRSEPILALRSSTPATLWPPATHSPECGAAVGPMFVRRRRSQASRRRAEPGSRRASSRWRSSTVRTTGPSCRLEPCRGVGQLGEAAAAVKWLQRAADTGFPSYPWVARDPMLTTIRSACPPTSSPSWSASRSDTSGRSSDIERPAEGLHTRFALLSVWPRSTRPSSNRPAGRIRNDCQINRWRTVCRCPRRLVDGRTGIGARDCRRAELLHVSVHPGKSISAEPESRLDEPGFPRGCRRGRTTHGRRDRGHHRRECLHF